jgi:hypothetical protein
LSEAAISSVLRAAIRADVSNRLDEIAERLEYRVESSERLEDVEQLLAEALTEATRVVADGFAARLREARPAAG